jgi:ubiquinone/menaquinone biosynthesis C-methylase UbiE
VSAVTSALRSFIVANRKVSERLAPLFPQARHDLHIEWRETVGRYAAMLDDGALIVDAGGGKSCAFKANLPGGKSLRIVAVDISEDELERNRDVDEWRVADISAALPFADGEVDMVVTRSVVEHLEDPAGFAAETFRVLKPGARTIHIIPGKFGLVSIVNQLLPKRVARKLVHLVVPGSDETLGFPAFYRKTYPSAFATLLSEQGFEIEELRVSYSQGYYFASFVPLYLAVSTLELALERLKARNLSALFLVVARKPQASTA